MVELGFVYRIHNLKNEKSYVGETSALCRRFTDHVMRCGNRLLKADIKKYGIECFTFEILELCLTKEERLEKEAFYMGEFKAFPLGYNIRAGHLRPKRMTRQEAQKFIGARVKKSWTGASGEKRREILRSIPVRTKLSERAKAQWANPEIKEKMKQAALAAWSRRKLLLTSK